jgi:hypothetical protein
MITDFKTLADIMTRLNHREDKIGRTETLSILHSIVPQTNLEDRSPG